MLNSNLINDIEKTKFMKAFIAQIIYSIKCEGVQTNQYEEEWRLFYADDADDALQKARNTAINEEEILIDRHGRSISWKLIAVKDLQEVNLENGALLFSTVKEMEPIAAPVWAI
jgi:hypothetical protein